ncbi:MAG: reverse transcriptase family protein [Pseudomonadota bacterium]
MRLPHTLYSRLCFIFPSGKDLIAALGSDNLDESIEIERLLALGLPPISSRNALSVMLGINLGFLWSLENRPSRYYRRFTIQKGMRHRIIDAPLVSLKIIQKWIGFHLANAYLRPSHVFGFVPELSHIDAAKQHVGAEWVISLDIRNFFQTTPLDLVSSSLASIGYSDESARLIARLACLRGFLAQGSPASPVISNIAFSGIDLRLREIADAYGCRLTRYADDIVFSGHGELPSDLLQNAINVFDDSPWRVSIEKIRQDRLPGRLKVHGLLVHQERVRLTKGYRNKLRAYQHLWSDDKIVDADKARIRGHLLYSQQIDRARET